MCIKEIISHLEKSDDQKLVPLLFRLAGNYKMLEIPELKQFVSKLVSQKKVIDLKLLEALISIGLTAEAYQLIEKTDIELIKKDKKILGIYLNLLVEKKPAEALKICQKLDVPRPSDLFDEKVVD
jgi:hypothetical protein